MKLKEKIKRFLTLDVHGHEGFTLVELIIVIAILAILSSVAVVGYSSYVKKANMQADKTLVAEIANALTLAYYANPNAARDMVVSVVLTDGGAKPSDETNAFIDDAMKAAYGDDWQNKLKLKYTQWGNGVAVSKEVISYFMSNDNDALDKIFSGEANISYTDNIPELFELMEDTAIVIAGKRQETLGSGANMVTDAAGITIGKDAEEFSELWASEAWQSNFLMGDAADDYGADIGNAQTTDETLKLAIANAAVIKARNEALAAYLSDLGYGSVAGAIANYTYPGSVVPDDAAGAFLGGNADALGLTFSSDEEEEAVYCAICDYYGMDYDTLEVTDITKTQSYTDGLAYYAMMSTVNELKDSTNVDKNDDSTWWNDLYSAVDMYSAIANGTVTREELNEMYGGMNVGNNSVVIMLIVSNGEARIMISPVGANS